MMKGQPISDELGWVDVDKTTLQHVRYRECRVCVCVCVYCVMLVCPAHTDNVCVCVLCDACPAHAYSVCVCIV